MVLSPCLRTCIPVRLRVEVDVADDDAVVVAEADRVYVAVVVADSAERSERPELSKSKRE